MSINIKTYLTPSIPMEIFVILSKYIENKIGVPVNLIFETTSSGPKKGEKINEDLSFMCTPPYYWLYDNYKNDIELLPYAPVFDDIRNNNEALYFSDVLVHKDSSIKSIFFSKKLKYQSETDSIISLVLSTGCHLSNFFALPISSCRRPDS